MLPDHTSINPDNTEKAGVYAMDASEHRDIAACTNCDWLGNRPDVLDAYEDADVCPECETDVEWIMVARQQPRGAVVDGPERYRAGEDAVNTRVVDYGGPGLPSIIATCPNRGAAQKVARALNAAAGAVDPSEVGRLRGALRRAHEQLSKHDYKGPKQIGRAMMTIEGVMPELARAFDEEDADG